MKRLAIFGAATALLLASGAHAQVARTFTMTGTWTEPVFTGGIGPERMAARAGDITGTFEVVGGDGAHVTGTAHCVGMNQHPSQIFALVLSCDSADSGGSEVSWLLLCNPIGEPGTPQQLGCVGGIQGTAGGLDGTRGLMTMHFRGGGMTTGTGQWLN